MTTHIRQFIDEMRAAQNMRDINIPRISARGATSDEIERTAFEVARHLTIALVAARALVDNLNENLPRPVNATARLDDMMGFAIDIASEIRGRVGR